MFLFYYINFDVPFEMSPHFRIISKHCPSLTSENSPVIVIQQWD